MTSADGSASRLHASLTDLVFQVFRLNGELLAAGDALVDDLGLTSARWQVLGAVDLAPVPLPVAQLARTIGLTRQAVQRSVDELLKDGLVQLEPNPHHRRASLVTMTARGRDAFRLAGERQVRWADDLVADLPVAAIDRARTTLRALQQRLVQHGADMASSAKRATANPSLKDV